MLSSLQSWTHGHLLNFLGAKHSYWSYKQGIYDEQEIAVVELCGEFVRAYAVELLHDLSGNKTRRYKVAHCSTCPNIRGTDKTKLGMHHNTPYHKLQGKTNQRKHRIIQQFLPLLNQKTTHRNIYSINMLFWLGAWVAKASSQSLCDVKKNNKHSLIPVLATVTHTTNHGKSNTATRVQIVLGSSTACGRATDRGYPQGSALRMVPSRIVWWCPCESRCLHWLRADHVFLQNLPLNNPHNIKVRNTFSISTVKRCS